MKKIIFLFGVVTGVYSSIAQTNTVTTGMYFVKMEGCHNCGAVYPMIQEFQKVYGKKIIKIISPEESDRLGFKTDTYPTVLFIESGKEIKRFVGTDQITETSVGKMLNRLLKTADIHPDITFSEQDPADVAVIGAGPAGCEAAQYTARNGLKTLLFGKSATSVLAGVKLVNNWPTRLEEYGNRLLFKMWDQARSVGAHIAEETIQHIDFSRRPYKLVSESGKTYFAKTLILAMGMSHQTLDVPGIKKYWGKGIAVCSLCDAASSKGKDIIIYGQQDIVEMLEHLIALAKKVTLIIPEKDIVDPLLKQIVKKHKIDVRRRAHIKEVVGDGTNAISYVVLQQNGREKREPAAVLFLGLGRVPNSRLAQGLSRDALGYIKTNRNQETSKQGVFAAGDITDHPYKQSVIAASQGLTAAISDLKYLLGQK